MFSAVLIYCGCPRSLAFGDRGSNTFQWWMAHISGVLHDCVCPIHTAFFAGWVGTTNLCGGLQVSLLRPGFKQRHNNLLRAFRPGIVMSKLQPLRHIRPLYKSSLDRTIEFDLHHHLFESQVPQQLQRRSR